MQMAVSTFRVEYVKKPSAQYEKTLLKKGLSGMCTILQVMRSTGRMLTILLILWVIVNVYMNDLIEIIFCTVMLDKGIISAQMFTALLFMAIFSTVATTPIVTKRLKFPLKLEHS